MDWENPFSLKVMQKLKLFENYLLVDINLPQLVLTSQLNRYHLWSTTWINSMSSTISDMGEQPQTSLTILSDAIKFPDDFMFKNLLNLWFDLNENTRELFETVNLELNLAIYSVRSVSIQASRMDLFEKIVNGSITVLRCLNDF